MAVGAVVGALINKTASEKAMSKKGSTTNLPFLSRRIWPPLLYLMFSVFMFIVCIVRIVPYCHSTSPATGRTVVTIVIYGVSLFCFFCIAAFSGGVLSYEIQKRRPNHPMQRTETSDDAKG
jgi:hypothetical protein